MIDKSQRKAILRNSFRFFFNYYFGHYVKYDTADFQVDIQNTLQDWDNKFLEIIAFRGSAKSTMAMFAFPIWCVVTSKAKFPVLISDTFGQAKTHIYNLKTELENNKKLIADWGPFAGKDEWTATEMVLPNYDARIVAKSTGQKVRGIRHKQFRPDLVVVDDIENLIMVRTKDQRDKTYRWFSGDVLPAGDLDTRYILIGNLLHTDAIMNRVRQEILDGKKKGVLKEFPFFDKDGKPLWAGKFNTQELIDEEKAKYDERTWQREFLLKIIPEEGQIVQEDWIEANRYKVLPEGEELFNQGTGVDLAISQKDGAAFTAMVSAKLFMVNDKPQIYVMANPVNERLTAHETTERASEVSKALGDGSLTSLWVEQVGYQQSQIEAMQRAGLPAEGVKVSTDKAARLRTVTTYIQNGTIKFPEKGCEDLILQLVGFGIEAYVDLVDAFVFVIQALMNDVTAAPKLTIF